jgi:DMSO/TMAO reductase YedYZ molybdopterin-dependent catalytic subunit
MSGHNAILRLAAILFVAIVASSAALADGVVIAGQVQHPATLTVADLEKLPAASAAVSFETDHGPQSANYTGALLWTVLSNAGPVDAPGKNAKLRHTYLVSASDGYAVSLSEGELDPNFEGKSVILAYAKDGKPLDAADGIRLIVPGDRHGGRAVRGVVKIDVQ